LRTIRDRSGQRASVKEGFVTDRLVARALSFAVMQLTIADGASFRHDAQRGERQPANRMPAFNDKDG
jgi:hypothetical protein